MTIIIPAPRSPRMSPGYRNSAALLYEVPTTVPAAGKAIVERGNVKTLLRYTSTVRSKTPLGKKPFKPQLTVDLKKGANTLEVRVTNLGENRIIGNAQPGTTEKTTFTTMPLYQANSPLLLSGLLGPVTIVSKR